jgi:hypothetical protein
MAFSPVVYTRKDESGHWIIAEILKRYRIGGRAREAGSGYK